MFTEEDFLKLIEAATAINRAGRLTMEAKQHKVDASKALGEAHNRLLGLRQKCDSLRLLEIANRTLSLLDPGTEMLTIPGLSAFAEIAEECACDKPLPGSPTKKEWGKKEWYVYEGNQRLSGPHFVYDAIVKASDMEKTNPKTKYTIKE